MALPDELDISWLGNQAAGPYEVSALIDAIDAASDQDHTTWLTQGRKRIAKIAPVDEIPDAITAWAADVRISADEFRALSLDKRRALLDQFYTRLPGGPSGRLEPSRS